MIHRCMRARVRSFQPQFRPVLLGSTGCRSAVPADQCSSSTVSIEKYLPSRGTFSLATTDSKALGPHMLPQLFSTLHLSSFSEKEIRASFDAVDVDRSGYLEHGEVRDLICRMNTGHACGSKIDERSEQMASCLMSQLNSNKDSSISWNDFHTGIVLMAGQRDPRVWPYVGSMVMAGMAVGVVMPAMPVLATTMGVTTAQFGVITSAFGLAKLLSTIPSGVLVDEHGRRSILVAGNWICGFGYLGIAFATSFEQILLARFVMGMGAAFTMAGATMAATDISNSLNRARMMGPVMSAFSVGAAVGPAIGGVLIGAVGVQSCFGMVSGMFFMNALATQRFACETHVVANTPKMSIVNATREIFAQWVPLCKDTRFRQLLLVNGAYWVALAGGTMTVIPLMLTGHFALAPAEVGLVFAMQSVVSVLGTEPVARLADRLGPEQLLAPSLATMAMTLAVLPMAADIWTATPALALMALSSTALLTAPTAAVGNLATAANRAQSLALLRTAGNAGWLLGGVSVGTAAGMFGTDIGLQGAAGFLLATSAWYALRRVAPKL